MTKEQKMNLLRFLYSNEQTQSFLCNDLFQEFMEIIPKTNCICSANQILKTRRENHTNAVLSIHEFLANNPDYYSIVKSMFSHYEDRELEAHLLMGYVFYLALVNNSDIDIFKNKKSICYTDGPSIVDIIS